MQNKLFHLFHKPYTHKTGAKNSRLAYSVVLITATTKRVKKSMAYFGFKTVTFRS